MKLLTPSRTTSPNENSLNQFDRKTAGYIRLLSSVLDEPIESVVQSLRSELPIVAALGTSRKDRPAA